MYLNENEIQNEIRHEIDIEYFIDKVIKDSMGSHWIIKKGRICLSKMGRYPYFHEGKSYDGEYGNPRKHHTVYAIHLFKYNYNGITYFELGFYMLTQGLEIPISERNYKKYFNEGICFTRNKNIDKILNE